MSQERIESVVRRNRANQLRHAALQAAKPNALKPPRESIRSVPEGATQEEANAIAVSNRGQSQAYYAKLQKRYQNALNKLQAVLKNPQLYSKEQVAELLEGLPKPELLHDPASEENQAYYQRKFDESQALYNKVHTLYRTKVARLRLKRVPPHKRKHLEANKRPAGMRQSRYERLNTGELGPRHASGNIAAGTMANGPANPTGAAVNAGAPPPANPALRLAASTGGDALRSGNTKRTASAAGSSNTLNPSKRRKLEQAKASGVFTDEQIAVLHMLFAEDEESGDSGSHPGGGQPRGHDPAALQRSAARAGNLPRQNASSSRDGTPDGGLGTDNEGDGHSDPAPHTRNETPTATGTRPDGFGIPRLLHKDMGGLMAQQPAQANDPSSPDAASWPFAFRGALASQPLPDMRALAAMAWNQLDPEAKAFFKSMGFDPQIWDARFNANPIVPSALTTQRKPFAQLTPHQKKFLRDRNISADDWDSGRVLQLLMGLSA